MGRGRETHARCTGVFTDDSKLSRLVTSARTTV
jgi:hypothetical protein